jgi:hypothetical protein
MLIQQQLFVEMSTGNLSCCSCWVCAFKFAFVKLKLEGFKSRLQFAAIPAQGFANHTLQCKGLQKAHNASNTATYCYTHWSNVKFGW